PHVRGLMDVCGGGGGGMNTPIPPPYPALGRHGLGLPVLSPPRLIAPPPGRGGGPLLALPRCFLPGGALTAGDDEGPFGPGRGRPGPVGLLRDDSAVGRAGVRVGVSRTACGPPG